MGDFFQIVVTHGWTVAIAVMLGGALLYIVITVLSRSVTGHIAVARQIVDAMSETDKEGRTVVIPRRRLVAELGFILEEIQANRAHMLEAIESFRESMKVHQERYSKFFERAEFLSSEEHWKGCSIENCPYLGDIGKANAQLVRDIAELQASTHLWWADVNNSFHAIIAEQAGLTKEVIQILRDFALRQRIHGAWDTAADQDQSN